MGFLPPCQNNSINMILTILCPVLIIIFVSRYCNKYKSVIGSIENSYSNQNNKSTKEIHGECLKKEFGKLINLDSCNEGYRSEIYRINTELDMLFK